jgi:hypothetical protein
VDRSSVKIEKPTQTAQILMADTPTVQHRNDVAGADAAMLMWAVGAPVTLAYQGQASLPGSAASLSVGANSSNVTFGVASLGGLTCSTGRQMSSNGNGEAHVVPFFAVQHDELSIAAEHGIVGGDVKAAKVAVVSASIHRMLLLLRVPEALPRSGFISHVCVCWLRVAKILPTLYVCSVLSCFIGSMRLVPHCPCLIADRHLANTVATLCFGNAGWH